MTRHLGGGSLIACDRSRVHACASLCSVPARLYCARVFWEKWMRLLTLSGAGLIALALAGGCPKEEAKATEPAAPAVPAGPVGAKLTTTPEITAADLAARDKELADDKWEGRGP